MNAICKRIGLLSLLVLLLTPLPGCHLDPNLLDDGQSQLRESELRMGTLLAQARRHRGGTYVGLTEMVKKDPELVKVVLDPLIARLKIFEAKLARSREQSDRSGNKGLVFAFVPCYVERGDVKVDKSSDSPRCLFHGKTWPPRPLEMVAAVPLGVNDETIVSYGGGRNSLLEFVTVDRNQPKDSQTYFFGNKQLTSGYILAALDIAGADDLLSNPGVLSLTLAAKCGIFNLIDEVPDDPKEEFFCRFGKVLFEVAHGGYSLVEKVAESLGL